MAEALRTCSCDDISAVSPGHQPSARTTFGFGIEQCHSSSWEATEASDTKRSSFAIQIPEPKYVGSPRKRKHGNFGQKLSRWRKGVLRCAFCDVMDTKRTSSLYGSGTWNGSSASLYAVDRYGKEVRNQPVYYHPERIEQPAATVVQA